jgi:hypothetical protein
MNPKLQIMFTGGVTNTAAEGSDITEVMSAEIRQLGVRAEQIILDPTGCARETQAPQDEGDGK